MRLAYEALVIPLRIKRWWVTHVFDVRARVDGDDIAVLHAQIVADDSVYPRGTVVEVIICKHYENRILALLALD